MVNKAAFKPAESYGFWKYLTRKENVDFSRDFLLDKKASKESIESIRHYFHKMVKYQGRKRLVFKITGPSRIGYLMSIFSDACFIHLHRRDVPVIDSFLKVGFWKYRGYNKLWWHVAYTKD